MSMMVELAIEQSVGKRMQTIVNQNGIKIEIELNCIILFRWNSIDANTLTLL